MSRVFDAICAEPWCIRGESLRLIAAIAQRNLDAPEIAAARPPRPDARSRTSTVEDGVAIVPITGPIFPRANMLTEMSGATSLQLVSRDVQAALDDTAVHAVLLEIDSPGGVAFGINEFADLLFASRGRKPLVAYVSGMAASAAYWIATSVGEVVVDTTALLGSIGVVQAVRVQEEVDLHGERQIEIVSSNAPNKRPDPRTDDGLAEILRMLDGLEEVFVGAVARNRAVSVDRVLSDFGRGGVIRGDQAVALGMADRVGTLRGVLAGLAARPTIATSLPSTAQRQHSITGSIMDPKRLAEFAAEQPDLAAALRDDGAKQAAAELQGKTDALVAAARTEGKAAGVAEERARQAAIDAACAPGFETLAAECKADGSTAEQFALKALALAKQQGSNALAAATADAKATAAKLPPPDASATGEADAAAAAGGDPVEADKTRWQASAELRAEFGDEKAYLAFRAAERAGRIRMYGGRAA